MNAEYDDLRIYNTALTATQVQSVYSSQGAPAPSRAMPLPRLAWAFDGTTTDYVNGLAGTTTGTVSYNASGKYGQSLIITNTAGLVASNYVSYSTPYYPSTLTTAVWLKLNTIGVGNQYFLEFGGISYVIYINSNNTVGFRVQAQGGVATTISTVSTVTAGQWYHIAAVIDGYNQTIYLNGVIAAGPSPCNTLAFSYSALRIGGSNNLSRVLVNGELDDLRIFDRALTSAQVQSVYNQQGVPGRGAFGNVVGIIKASLTGTPLFSQLSSAATSSAVGAFSLRAVNGTSVKAVQVRNGTTSATQDFYADRLGNLLTAPVVGQPLANWLGGATGYVTTWYDQSGCGNHATQATAANQPIIQRATKGPGYACLFNGAQSIVIDSYAWLNGTPYTVCASERRTTGLSRTFFGGNTPSVQDQKLNLCYNPSTSLRLAQYADDLGVTVPDYISGETISYNFFTHNTNHTANIWSYRSSTYKTTGNLLAFLSAPSGSYRIGTGHSGFYTGEIYELLVFTQSLYDLDTSGGLITKIYQNQLGAYGT
jgi:hypothetical protein